MPASIASSHVLHPVIHLHESGRGHRPRGYRVPMRRMHWTVVEYASGGTWLIETPEGGILKASPGRVFVVPTDHPHQLTQVGPRATTSHWWMVSLLDAIGRDILRNLPSPWVLSHQDSIRLIHVMRRLRLPCDSLADLLRLRETEFAVLRQIVESSPSPLLPQRPCDTRIDAVLHHIHTHLDRRLSRSQLAAIAELSPTRFHYVFLDATGVSPTQYVLAQRMQRARELLYATSDSVKQIAAACGFADPSRFSRVFHARVGLSPLAYREQSPVG